MELKFTTDWFTSNISVWEEHLAEFKGEPDLDFLEIGSWEGRSACWLLQNILTHSTSTLTCIDIFPIIDSKAIEYYATVWGLTPPYPQKIDTESHFDHNVRTIGASERVNKLKGESRKHLRTLPFNHYDCIFIDGSHWCVDVLKDTLLSWDLLRNNGILIFDDYQLNMYENPEHNPKKSIDSFLSAFKDQLEVLHSEWQIIVRKHTADTPIISLKNLPDPHKQSVLSRLQNP